MNDKAIENPLREVGKQFQWEFMNPAISSRGTKDGYKYFLKVEIQKEIHDLLVDAELAGMVVANVGSVAGLNGDYSVAKKEMVKAEAEKAEKCPEAIKYHKDHGKWPSNTADSICKESNFHMFLLSIKYVVTNDYECLNEWLKFHCGIESKSELDTNPDVLNVFMGTLTNYRKFVQDNKL